MAFGEIFHVGQGQGSPERARLLHLASSGSQSQDLQDLIHLAHSQS